MEIYNEAVRDLLSSDGSPLRLLDDPEVEKCTHECPSICLNETPKLTCNLCCLERDCRGETHRGNSKGSMAPQGASFYLCRCCGTNVRTPFTVSRSLIHHVFFYRTATGRRDVAE